MHVTIVSGSERLVVLNMAPASMLCCRSQWLPCCHPCWRARDGSGMESGDRLLQCPGCWCAYHGRIVWPGLGGVPVDVGVSVVRHGFGGIGGTNIVPMEEMPPGSSRLLPAPYIPGALIVLDAGRGRAIGGDQLLGKKRLMEGPLLPVSQGISCD
ncbi:hypothetical protein BT67DRAFT_457899 [Trichocladium antarcticum]|uniref:Uncharacterized protein n=1 Tax=Trichocladium antarcticum TaxID=1450529 RepID=A0AAN6ZBD1_9PEZI|nr:hypothetical protein BT67DRAFT_457899 [Trichocladium antarcticum]